MSAFALGLGGGYFASRFPSRTEVQAESDAVVEATANVENIPSEPDASLSPAASPIAPTLHPQPVANSPLVISSGLSAEERHRQLQELPPEAFPTLIAELCSDIGPEGVDFQEQYLIRDGLRKWWYINREALLQWVASRPNSGTKRYLMSQILKDLLWEEPERAKTLAEAYRLQDAKWAEKEYNNIMISGPIEAAWQNPQTTADQMLALYKRANRGSHTQGSGVGIYPEGFDFRKFLDGMDAMDEADGLQSSIMPGDTLTAWAKQDPQQAAQWLLQATAKWNEQSRFGRTIGGGWQDIARAVAGNRGPQAYYDWVAKFVGDLDETSRRSLLSAYGREGDVLGILSATKDATTRDKVLTSAMGASDTEQTLTYLKMLSTPEARLSAIKSNRQNLAELTKDFEVDKSVYRQLGLTETQVQEALAEDD